MKSRLLGDPELVCPMLNALNPRFHTTPENCRFNKRWSIAQPMGNEGTGSRSSGGHVKHSIQAKVCLLLRSSSSSESDPPELF